MEEAPFGTFIGTCFLLGFYVFLLSLPFSLSSLEAAHYPQP